MSIQPVTNWFGAFSVHIWTKCMDGFLNKRTKSITWDSCYLYMFLQKDGLLWSWTPVLLNFIKGTCNCLLLVSFKKIQFACFYGLFNFAKTGLGSSWADTQVGKFLKDSSVSHHWNAGQMFCSWLSLKIGLLTQYIKQHGSSLQTWTRRTLCDSMKLFYFLVSVMT